MTEPTLFGIGKNQWDLIHGFASWLAAFGSLGAAAVALYLANRAAKPSGMASVGHRVIIAPGSVKPYPEYAVLRIVNTGDRPIRVVQLGWKVGLFRKRFAVQMYDAGQSSALPIELNHGQEAAWFVPLAARDEPWLTCFAKGMLMPHYRTSLWTLRAQVYTSVGHVFQARPEEGLMKRLRKACQQLKGEANTNTALQPTAPKQRGG